MTESGQSSRRIFLKAGAASSLAVSLFPALASAALNDTGHEGKRSSGIHGPNVAKMRTLGAGSASLRVSAIGMGAMGMSHNRGIAPSSEASIALLRRAAELGVTFFDTAENYGPFVNEELVGRALRPYLDEVVIATKFGHEILPSGPTGKYDSRPERIRLVAEQSLMRLGVESLDLFYQHRFDPKIPIEDVAGTVRDLIQEGKVKRFGVCEVDADIIRRAHAVQPITAVQSEYHLMWRDAEKSVFPTLQELGIGFVPYSPLNRGFLTGALNQHTRFDTQNDNRPSLPRFAPEAMGANLALVEVLSEFGKTRGLTPAQVSLAWMSAKQPWIVPIPGTTKLAHLEENLRSSQIELSADEIAQLEQAISAVKIIGRHIKT